jgi:hypothetical protein
LCAVVVKAAWQRGKGLPLQDFLRPDENISAAVCSTLLERALLHAVEAWGRRPEGPAWKLLDTGLEVRIEDPLACIGPIKNPLWC